MASTDQPGLLSGILDRHGDRCVNIYTRIDISRAIGYPIKNGTRQQTHCQTAAGRGVRAPFGQGIAS